MRLLPAQIAIRLICGHALPRSMRTNTQEQNIREGRRMLVQMCGCDHGYDLIAWHNELCETKAGGKPVVIGGANVPACQRTFRAQWTIPHGGKPSLKLNALTPNEWRGARINEPPDNK